MSTTYGLTDDGFVPMPVAVIRQDLNDALRAAFGASIDLGDRSIFGQIVGILAERYALLWEQTEAVNSSQDPDKATGIALDALCALTGTVRPVATHSSVPLTLFGANATVVPSGTVVASASTGVKFATSADATITTVANWAASTDYIVGNRVFSDVDRIYQCITAGTSDPSVPVSGNTSDITDGTVHWKMIADNAVGGAVDVIAAAVDTGPVTAVAGDLTVKINDVVGWNAVTNLLDATKGRSLAQDSELRVLRQNELSGDGESTADAIRAKLLKITDVIAATVFVNDSDVTNSDGMPPHSVEALVRPTWSIGDARDQQIYDALFKNVAAGIVTTGSQIGTVTDSQGVDHTIKFSRPTEIPIYIVLNVLVDATKFPADGAAEIQDAITAWGDLQATGKDAVASAISAQAFTVPGMLDVTSCFIGTSPAPATSTTVAISLRQLATYDTSRISVVVSTGTP